MHQAEQQRRLPGAGRDGLIDACSNSPSSAARTPWCYAKHSLARISTARKSLAPAATRFGSAPRSPLLNVALIGIVLVVLRIWVLEARRR